MTDEKTEEKKLGMAINNCRFGFVVTFDSQPSTQEFCEGLISLFQTASKVVLQKDAINQALEDAKGQEKKQFYLEAYLDEKTGTLEAKLAVQKERPNIVVPGSPRGKLVVPPQFRGGKRR